MARILVTDDEVALQRLITRYAVMDGHEVLSAASGAELRTLLTHERPDLILLDLRLHDAKGEDLLAELKADVRTADIPVILWSGSEGVIGRERALELGAIDLVAKTSIKDVMARIGQFLS